MHVLIVTFSLAGLDDSTYRQVATDLAPQFAQVPGLASKTWLADAESNTYGGVYFFENAASLQAYLASEIVTAMQANPALAGLNVRTFGTVESATAITGGPLAASMVAA